MKQRVVLIVGSGGREHALACRLQRCPNVERVAVVPGNAGTERSGFGCGQSDPHAAALQLQPSLIVIGPEAPLAAGVSDELRAAGFAVYGPSQAAAQLESSKAFMKAFAVRHGLRTARHIAVQAPSELKAALSQFREPPVVKASGLCAGKGVVVAESFQEAEVSALGMLTGEAFGTAGSIVVLEERLLGEEVSVHAVCDGAQSYLLPAVQDHKRIGEGDVGANTGGMGTYGPAPVVSAAQLKEIQRSMIEPTLRGMRAEGYPFIGTLFAGLMISPSGEPLLLEFNTRFGDPETQVMMGLLEGDFYQLLHSAALGSLDTTAVSYNEKHAVCVVMAAAGYPEKPRSGDVITGLSQAELVPGVAVYHAGTRFSGEQLLTAGGRVLGVTAVADGFEAARRQAYQACAALQFEGAQYRRDIGHRALNRA